MDRSTCSSFALLFLTACSGDGPVGIHDYGREGSFACAAAGTNSTALNGRCVCDDGTLRAWPESDRDFRCAAPHLVDAAGPLCYSGADGICTLSCAKDPDCAPCADNGSAHCLTLMDREWLQAQSGLPNYMEVRRGFDLGTGTFSSFKITVALESECYPVAERPPPGHNWPRKCDPFDRIYTVVLNHPEDESDPPAVAILRGATPFGGPMETELVLTDLANGLRGEQELRVHISTGADPTGQATGVDAGWIVSTYIEAVPGPAPRRVVGFVPLWGGDVYQDTVVPEIDFTTPRGASDARLEYYTTGHGVAWRDGVPGRVYPGCIGHADEFCQRTHHIFIDGVETDDFVPWRDDCEELCTRATLGGQQFCAENPMGDIQSVEAPRANWCPGSATPPRFPRAVGIADPGEHTFRFSIDDIAPGSARWGVWAHILFFD